MRPRRLPRRPAAAPRLVRRPRDLLIHVDAAPREALDAVSGPFERPVGVLRGDRVPGDPPRRGS